jgi:hypothetical protein
MKVLTRHDIELIETVQAHLKNLASLSAHNANQATVRVATGALRALISEEMLQRAWGTFRLRGPVTFRTYAITSTCGDDVIAYCGGGDILPGVPFSVGRNATLEERILNLKNFHRQTRIQIGTETASTNDIISMSRTHWVRLILTQAARPLTSTISCGVSNLVRSGSFPF